MTSFREILYNDIRQSGHDLSAFQQFLEFEAIAAPFAPILLTPINSPVSAVQQQRVGASVFTASAGVGSPPPLPEVPQPPSNTESSVELPLSSPPAQATSTVDELPLSAPPLQETAPPLPEVPSAPPVAQQQQQSTPSPVPLSTPSPAPPVPTFPISEARPEATSPSPPVSATPTASVQQAPPVPELPAPDVPEAPAPEVPDVEITPPTWTHDEIEDAFHQHAPVNVPVPPIPGRPSPPPVRGASSRDPTGHAQLAAEKRDEELSTRSIVDEMMEYQDQSTQRASSVTSLMLDAIETLGVDNNNDERRAQDLVSALQFDRHSLTDVHF